jgi:hypothetical protein
VFAHYRPVHLRRSSFVNLESYQDLSTPSPISSYSIVYVSAHVKSGRRNRDLQRGASRGRYTRVRKKKRAGALLAPPYPHEKYKRRPSPSIKLPRSPPNPRSRSTTRSNRAAPCKHTPRHQRDLASWTSLHSHRSSMISQ